MGRMPPKFDPNRPPILASDSPLSGDEALALANSVETWNGGFCRVMLPSGRMKGYKPFEPPPAEATQL